MKTCNGCGNKCDNKKEKFCDNCDNCQRNYCSDCMGETLKCWGCADSINNNNNINNNKNNKNKTTTFCNKCDPYSRREPSDEEILNFLLLHFGIEKQEAIEMWQKEQDIIPVTCAVCNNCDDTECDNLRSQYIPLSPSQHENTYKLKNSFGDKEQEEQEEQLQGALYYPHRRPLGCCCQCYFPITTNSIGYNIREEWCSKCVKRSIM